MMRPCISWRFISFTLQVLQSLLDLPVTVYKWIVDLFGGHAHCTMFNGEELSTAGISASIIQGSGIRPAAYAVISADMRPIHSGNSMVKFADDTYLVIPSASVGTRTQEIDNVTLWVVENNLKLNVLKTRDRLSQVQAENSYNTATTAARHLSR